MVPILPFHQGEAALHCSARHLSERPLTSCHCATHSRPQFPAQATQILAVLLHVVKAGNFAQTSCITKSTCIYLHVVCICLTIFLFIYLSIFLSFFLSFFLSVFLSIYLSFFLSFIFFFFICSFSIY